jgi:hypothetical protein
MGAIGANPEDVVATGPGERIARAGGGGIAAMAIPTGAIRAAPTLGRTALEIGRNALTGLAAGSGGEAAAEVAPEGLKPAARVLGGMAGGIGAFGAMEAAPRILAQGGRSLAAPFTAAGQEAVAGQRLENAVSDPASFRAALDNTAGIVPGSKPTTFQATGDMGIGALERGVATRNPAEFQQRRAEQNTARRQQLDQLQASGDPVQLSNYVKNQLKWFDEQTQADIDTATNVARGRAESLGGARAPEEYGADLRGAAQTAENTARAGERALWKAVDPEGNLTVATDRVRLEANGILSAMTKSAKPLGGDERLILDAAKGYGPTVAFKELGDLRSFTSDAMREELRNNGQSQAYARLAKMRSAIEDVINGAVKKQAQANPDQLLKGLAAFERDAQRFSTGIARGQSASPDVAWRTGDIPATAGSQSQGLGRSGNLAGDQSLPSNAEAPTFDAAAAERLRLATGATRNRVDTFGRGPVGAVLKKAGRQDQYGVSDASVPAKLFRPGNTGAEDVRAYRRAVPDDEAFQNLQDYAASSLRKAAMREDGTLDPAKVQSWTRQYSGALSEFPPQLRERITNASTASDVIADAASTRRSVMDTAQEGAFGKIAKMETPEGVTATIGGIFGSKDAVGQMRVLAKTANRNPDAREGLRKAVANFIQGKLISNTEAGTSGETLIKADQFQSFVKGNRGALREVFSEPEVQSLEAVAADLQRSNRSLSAVKLPGGSNTAQDTIAAGKAGPSVLGRLLSEAASATAGVGVGVASANPYLGWAAWLGTRSVAALRERGYARVDDLVRDAMLDPEKARVLLMKVPAKPDKTWQNVFAGRMVRAFGATGATTLAVPSEPEPEPGSRTAPVDVSRPKHVEAIRDRVDANPTDGQKEAGNYKKAHLKWQGLDVTLETPKGYERSGTSTDGTAWNVTMNHDYGYIKGTSGADNQQLDVYMGDRLGSKKVWVIDQKDLATGKFDEHKAMLGFGSRSEALDAYRDAFADNRADERIGGVKPMTVKEFKLYLERANLKRPASRSLAA